MEERGPVGERVSAVRPLTVAAGAPPAGSAIEPSLERTPALATQANFSESQASLLLDLLRAVAALLVCVGHWRYLFFVDYPQLPAHRALWFVPYLLCTLGRPAVMLFFVMSGYLIAGHVRRALRKGDWSWRRYALQRLVRLWIVLLPAMLLCGLWDGLALHFHVAPGLYRGMVDNHVTYDVLPHLGARAFFGNLAFLQNINVPTWGTDSPLWSLSNEFWYYAIFPLALIAAGGAKGVRTMARIVCGVAAVALLCVVGRAVLALFPVWLLGAALAFLPQRRTTLGVRWAASVVYWLFFLVLIKSHVLPGLAADLVLGALTAPYIYLLLGAMEPAPRSGLSHLVRRGAGFSYTLYLVHIPLLTLLAGLLAGEGRWVPVGTHLILGLGCLLLAIAFAYGVASVTEFHTGAVRQWLERRLLGRAGSDRSLERVNA